MKEQLISFETAKLAKEKGFNITTVYGYRKAGTLCDGKGFLANLKVYEAPTQSLLQKWLREKHNIHVWLIPSEIDKTYRAYVGYGIRLDLIESVHTQSFKTYEGALELGLQEAIKLIK